MVKEGAAVIDVGINRVQDPVTGKSKLVGDVDFEGKVWPLMWSFSTSLVSHTFSISVQVWDRRQASSLLYLEVWDPWQWRCLWKTLSKPLKVCWCIHPKGYAWQLHPNPNRQKKKQQWHIPALLAHTPKFSLSVLIWRNHVSSTSFPCTWTGKMIVLWLSACWQVHPCLDCYNHSCSLM